MVELLPFRERSCILESVYIMTVMTMEANRVCCIGVHHG